MSISQSDLRTLEFAVSKILHQEGTALTEEWQNAKNVDLKDFREPVTKFDIAHEKNIRSALSQLMPESGFIVEEGESDSKHDYNWIIDPIDQTKNFIGQVPLFYTQVALVQKDTPLLGVIFNPVSNQTFSASLGNGATLNGARLVRNVKNNLKESLIDVDFGNNFEDDVRKISIFRKLSVAAYRIRMTGGAYAPYIATGGIDGFVVINQRTKIVDQVPRTIIATELGLVSEDLQYADFHVKITASPALCGEIKTVLSEALD